MHIECDVINLFSYNNRGKVCSGVFHFLLLGLWLVCLQNPGHYQNGMQKDKLNYESDNPKFYMRQKLGLIKHSTFVGSK